MNEIFTTELKSEEITVAVAKDFVAKHNKEELERLIILSDYYNGKHRILQRTKGDELSNNRIVNNYASYIANFTSGYLLGSPVTYTGKNNANIDAVKEALEKAESSVQDSDLALDLSIFGRAYELCYMSSDERPTVKFAKISPLSAFVVYDDTVEQKAVFGVYYHKVTDVNGSEKYKATLVTAYFLKDFVMDTSFGVIEESEEVAHSFGDVPLIEIYNNGQRKGDFENVLSLIDADNLLQSDRVNDKEQYVNALLLLKGVTLGDDYEEKAETYNDLKTHRVMELPLDGDASYLSRQFDETSVEVLRSSIVSAIHKFSCVPDMTDESFASNTSGVAMKYKLIGLEQLAKVKERYFAEGLKYRLRLIQNILSIQGKPTVDISDISIKFNRSLPANELEEAQVVATLTDVLPVKRQLERLSFIEDVEAVAKELEEEKAVSVKNQLDAFINQPIIDDDE